MSLSVSLESPLIVRIWAWMQERFPLQAHGLFAVVLYLIAVVSARAVAGDAPVELAATDLVGSLVAWSFFLLLRVFDEHKDYELDVKNYPERILQSGLITLTHLKIMGFIAIVIQIAWSIFLDGGIAEVTIAWLILIFWASLMAKEFFIGAWLTQHLVLYALSHMMVMPLFIWWLAQLGHPGVALTQYLILLALLSFFTGFALEIIRKTRGPEEERATVDSYSKIFGPRGSASIVSLLLVVMASLQIYLIVVVFNGHFWMGYGLILIGSAFALFNIIKFIKQPSLRGREKNEGAVAVAVLLGYVAIIAAVFTERGIALTLF
ncbi:UbiA family prenyltransferase [Candidatus Marithioploca araucensis]|uniref:UbiA family prenyltransferase n=1 Tax=Candidatus Marithioploca araucensis TaxID=70273 RepID=A0ABT7VTU8_9GAMM|nr:UbiA family prenyltransferase [Candidatus Marithioploca araucensis]